MAHSDLKGLLCCPLCLENLEDPVTLSCGHNFCRVCIKKVLASQAPSGFYACPQCGEGSRQRPQLKSNAQLSNLAQHLRSTETAPKPSEVYCVSCVDSWVLAVKTCLLCGVSLCLDHLRLHSRSTEHVLVDVNRFLSQRRCSKHNRALDRYCWDHKACVCEDCSSATEHREHQMLAIDYAFDLKKRRLKDTMETLTAKWDKTLSRIHGLEKAKAELTCKLAHVNAMLNTADPFAVLLEKESEGFFFCDVQEEKWWKIKMIVIVVVFLLLAMIISIVVAAVFSGGKVARY